MYIRVINDFPFSYSIELLRRDNPLVSFPQTIPESTLDEYGVYRVRPTPPPTYNPLSQKLVKEQPSLVDGEWVQQWQVVDYTTEEIAAQQRQKDIAETTDPSKLTASLEVLTKALVGTNTLDSLSDEELDAVSNLYRGWVVGEQVTVDDLRKYNGVLWKCIQAHTTQIDWTPDVVPALWVRYREPSGGVQEWIAGEQVAVGDQRTYEGTTYEVIQAHTTQAGWEPPNVPALWAEVVI